MTLFAGNAADFDHNVFDSSPARGLARVSTLSAPPPAAGRAP